ncbi:hypothetical protein BOTBODRAFT_68375 [Botryobasidium botryosum FD-172 SS1]|uniref:Uncharacterized protein n=1 Tax=Botryobasidium botryosum (strain FD-172 SS1) TaxID=930990 RepID=A0A067MFU0_BOTB1|nr:hypothetical protein BOTBODRAFT_68375 [Botryobasidium botryosum FD-172 SS1]
MDAFVPRVQQLMLDLVGNSMTAQPSVHRFSGEPTGQDDCERLDDCPQSIKRELQILAEARDYAVGTIENFIGSKISELASRHNRMLAISSLPNDVLSIIFEHAYAAALADADAGLEGGTSKDAEEKRDAPLHFGLCASHVSRTWRHIALNMPRLWARIDAPVLELVDACLSRSRGLPLDIIFHKPSNVAGRVQYEEKVEGCVPSLLSHVERWRSLALLNVRPTHYSSIFSSSAARLGKLKLENVRGGGRLAVDIAFRMFSEKFLRLRELALSSVEIPLSSSIYRNLVNLTLESIVFNDSIEDFVRVLRACPLIEVFALIKVFFRRGGLPPIDSLIHLPYPKEVHFTFLRTSSSGYILSCIRVPPTMQIFGCYQLQAGENLDLIFPPPNLVSDTVPSLLGVTGLNFNFVSKPSTFALVCTAGTPGNDTPAVLDLEFPSLDQMNANFFSRQIFLGLGQALLFPNLVSFTLVGAAFDILPPSDFLQVLSRFSHIARLNLDRCAAPFMNLIGEGELSFPNLTSLSLSNLRRPLGLDMYRMPLVTPKDFGAILANLPNLDTIQFTNCSVTLSQTLKSAQSKHLCPRLEHLALEKCHILGADLAALVESRKEWGGEIVLETITVDSCAGVDERAILRLKDIVGQVQVL